VKYNQNDQVKVDKMSMVRSTTGGDEERMLLVGKPQEKRPLRTPRRKWVDNIKVDI
jgi:hypothetical protein